MYPISRRATTISRDGRSAQPAFHFRLDVGEVFDADREANEAVADALPLLLGRADVAVRGGPRVAARRRRVAQRRAEGDAGGRPQEAVDGVAAALQLEAEHAAQAGRQQALRQLVLGVV